jgi:hypothetical protein
MNSLSKILAWLTPSLRIAITMCTCLATNWAGVSAQTPYLEFRYEFDSAEAPLVDSTGQNANLGLGQNGVEHRFGEESLVGGDGFSLGLDAPGVGHPTGSYLIVPSAPSPETFSLSIWMKPLFTGQPEAIFARDNIWWPSPCNYYCLYIDPAQSLVWKTGGTESISTEGGIIEEDQVYHVVVTHLDTDGPDTGNANRSRVYVNGEMIDEVEGPEEIPSLDSIADDNGIFEYLWVGTLSSFGGFWGELDDLQMYSTELTPEQVAEMYANPGSLANLGGAPGDFDGDGELTVVDIDELSAAIRSGTTDTIYDLDGSGNISDDDRIVWVNGLKNTYFGDADLDGQFSSTDLVAVLASGAYEQDVDASWGTGDFDGDGRTNSSDLVTALADGGYELGPRASVLAVPEPASRAFVLLSLGVIGVLRRRSLAQWWNPPTAL